MSAASERLESGLLSVPTARISLRTLDVVLFAAVSGGVLIITTIPYLFAYRTTPPGAQFMGILLNVPDNAQYLSWARESMHQILFQNKLTAESGPAVYFNVFWLIVGRLASTLGIGLAEATQLVRPVAGAACMLAIAWFTRLIFPDRQRWWVATLVATLGAGLGWLLVLQKLLSGAPDVAFPLDIYVIETNAFLSIMAFPLQALAGGIVVAVLGLSALSFERNDFKLAHAAGLLAFILSLLHGYDLLVIYAVVGTVAVIRAATTGRLLRPIQLAVVICGWSVPMGFYNVYITRTDPIWRGTLSQYGNAGVYTPSVPHLFILMGVPLVLTVVGTIMLLKRSLRPAMIRDRLRSVPARELVLWTWLIVGFALLYIPTDFQIKMLVSWQVPLSIVATQTVFRLVPGAALHVTSRRSWLGPVVGGLLVVSVLPTNAYLFGWRLLDLGRHTYPYYLHLDELDAMHWLESHSASSDVVLSSLTTGQYIPSVSGNHAFLAHWAQTLNYYAKRGLVARFYAASTPDEIRRTALRDYNVGYVFYGPAEAALGNFDPATAGYLRSVYATGQVAIYAVETEKL